MTANTQLLPAPGARVGTVCGPGEFASDNPGTVLCHVTDRWGTHAVVLRDDGTTANCHSLNTPLAFAIRFFDQLTPGDAERMRKVLDKAAGSQP